MVSKIVKGVVIGSAIGAATVVVADLKMSNRGSKFGRKIMKAIGF